MSMRLGWVWLAATAVLTPVSACGPAPSASGPATAVAAPVETAAPAETPAAPTTAAAAAPSASATAVPTASAAEVASAAPAKPAKPAKPPQPTADSDARFELRGPKSAKVGEKPYVELVNVDDHDFARYHEGGNNGCAAYRWELRLRNAAGEWFTNEPPAGQKTCTMAIVQPKWIVIRSGASVKLFVDLGATFYSLGGPSKGNKGIGGIGSADKKPTALKPGKWFIEVVQVTASAPLELLP